MTMVRTLLTISTGLALSGAAHAQAVDIQPPPSAQAQQQAAQAADPGREPPIERQGLASRGSTNPAAALRTYGATIGTAIYSAIGSQIRTPIGSR